MTKNTTKTTTKTTAEKKIVRKTSPVREAFTTLITELKELTAAKKAKKAEMMKKVDALLAE